MKRVCLILLLLFGLNFLNAQIQHRCAFDHAVQYKDNIHPGFKSNADFIFEEAKRIAAAQNGPRSVYIVPLVFHVVWKNPSEKLPECKIIEQVAIMNRAYQRLNPDTANLRPIFSSVAANPQIQFRLDTIIWKQTTSDFFSGGFLPNISFSDRVKHDTSGGSESIDVNGHLNIWACNLGSSGILGYAYPPAGLTNWPANSQAPTPGDDGIVLDYRIVGADGLYSVQGTTINSKGNAAVHEAGHYFGLRHVWGDGVLSIFGFPDCNADDGVMDTPNCGIPSNYECDLTQNTCEVNVAGDLPDMIENFMDYSDELCQNTFTNGQVTIMHGVLSQERIGLTTSPPLHNTIRPSNDALTNAIDVTVNSAGNCNFNINGQNSGASESMPACSGTVSNDVWYSFTAISADVVLTLSNVQATAGASTDIVYELLSGSCGSLQSLGCFSGLTNTFDSLTLNETYYLRIYSNDQNSSQSYNLCLQTAGASSVSLAQLENEVKVYPNPGKGQLTVELPQQIQTSCVINIVNLLGQKISNSITVENYNEIIKLDLSSLPNGIYQMILNLNGNQINKPVVIQK
jgi:hypothetical protein